MKRAKKLFFKGFLLSFFLVGVLVTMAVLLYGAFIQNQGMKNEIPHVSDQSPDKVIGLEATVDSVSKNLIISWDQEGQSIHRMVLEIYRGPSSQLHYITIPMELQLTLSEQLYKSLLLVNPAIPQMLKINSLFEYIPKEVIFDSSARIIQEALGITLSYYTVVPQQVYKNGFETKENENSISYEVFRKEYKGNLETLNTEDKIKNYIELLYKDVESNLDLSDKLKYVEGYSKVKLSDITFEPLVGISKNQGFIVDSVEVSRQIAPYLQ